MVPDWLREQRPQGLLRAMGSHITRKSRLYPLCLLVSFITSFCVSVACQGTDLTSSQPHQLAIPRIQSHGRESPEEWDDRTRRLHQRRRAVWSVDYARYGLFSVFSTSLILLGRGYRLTDGLANICPSLRRLFNVLHFFNFPRIALFWAA